MLTPFPKLKLVCWADCSLLCMEAVQVRTHIILPAYGYLGPATRPYGPTAAGRRAVAVDATRLLYRPPYRFKFFAVVLSLFPWTHNCASRYRTVAFFELGGLLQFMMVTFKIWNVHGELMQSVVFADQHLVRYGINFRRFGGNLFLWHQGLLCREEG